MGEARNSRVPAGGLSRRFDGGFAAAGAEEIGGEGAGVDAQGGTRWRGLLPTAPSPLRRSVLPSSAISWRRHQKQHLAQRIFDLAASCGSTTAPDIIPPQAPDRKSVEWGKSESGR